MLVMDQGSKSLGPLTGEVATEPTASSDICRREVLKGAAATAGLAIAGGFVANIAHAASGTKTVVATTRSGRIRGYIDQGVKVFKGVRYGADTAARRFQPPVPPQPWKNIAETLTYGASSPQTGKNDAPFSEDCLFLNVWTPALRDKAKRPVMFYIHGGAYLHGSGSHPLYEGTQLCKRGDVVVVSVNHRLGATGYLYLANIPGAPASFADSGNTGMLDLVLALQWVRDNIEEFGGDPSRIMLFGQSGGGAKIATLMSMQAAHGLFHRAATMSGQQVTASGPLNATTRTRALLEALKLSPERLADIVTVPIDQLVAVMDTPDPIIGRGSLYFGPTLDERTIQRHPFYPDASPLGADIPMMIGNTHDETRGLIGGGDPATFELKWEDLAPRLARELRVDLLPQPVVDEYRKLYPQYTPTDVFFSATTAGRSWRAAIIEAELRAQQGKPAFVYQLDWASPKDGGKWGAPHGLDIPLVFGTLDAKGSITGTDDSARAMSSQLSETFIAFAKTGSPNNATIPSWEPYLVPRRATMVFNNPSKLVDDPRGAERRLFAKVPFTQQGT